MKICKHCNAEVEDELLVCPECGADMLEDEAVPADEAPIEEAPASEAPVEAAPAAETPASPKKKAPWGLIVGLGLAAVLVVGLIVGKSALDRKKAPADAPSDAQTQEQPVDPADMPKGHHVNAAGMPSYTITLRTEEDGAKTYYYLNEKGEEVTLTEEEVNALLDETVATCGDLAMTNRDLLYYNDQQFYAFFSMYGNYLGSMMDMNKPLDQQVSMDGTQTWQQFFVSASNDLFQQIAAFYQEAQKAGYTLTEEELAAIDVDVALAPMVESTGLGSVDELLQMQFGPAATKEGYQEYLKIGALAGSYAQHLASQLEASEQDLNDYYDKNAEQLKSMYQLEKDDTPMVNVRHILITPEQTTDADGNPTITEEAWAAAEKQANDLYAQWQSGEATEESFAALASEHTQDPGSKANGGLYEDVYPGQMVPEFNDWCFAEGRKTGDSGIVKTTYGYHIMFFVSQGDQPFWKMVVKDMVLQEKANTQRQEITALYESSADLTKAILLENERPVQEPAPEAPVEAAPAPETPVEETPAKEDAPAEESSTVENPTAEVPAE